MSAFPAQLSILSEPELYLAERARPAYFATLVPSYPRGQRQHCFNVENMSVVLNGLDRKRDSYIGQATFFRPFRRIATVADLGLVFADLDLPLLDELRRTFGDAYVVEFILRAIDEERIPAPSLIVFSGRGFHAKWLFEKALPYQALPRWSALEKTIVDRLRQVLGADPNCIDAARVLRLAETINTKSGAVARILWENRVNGEIVRYAFDLLCDEVFEKARASHHERAVEQRLATAKKKALARNLLVAPTYTRGSLWWSRLCDIRKLCALRGWTGESGVPEGHRDTVLFLGATALTWYAPMGTWWAETGTFARELVPTLSGSEWRQYVGATWRRMEATAKGGGEARYRYTTARIVSDLGISAEEQAKLSVLVSPELAAERKRENDRIRDEKRRRAAGAVERDAYIGRAAERAQKARELAESGLSTRQIAQRLGISRETARLALRSVDKSSSRCMSDAAPGGDKCSSRWIYGGASHSDGVGGGSL